MKYSAITLAFISACAAKSAEPPHTVEACPRYEMREIVDPFVRERPPVRVILVEPDLAPTPDANAQTGDAGCAPNCPIDF